ncbi:helix-turn-helix transcriptional regulator [Hydrogenophaga sp. BPS33]|uniref:helix-turn-helix transcriptional regulator n=1 Tax=Hydrogenophaga sp. BPS33 TaxID=2651974 RepID=UPI0013201DAF|nr:AraC family transcriptional regulator [Hydrogenophaga sp. BPS33]QHE83832.1 AraC family transcriptional regulator [Hydrogenophaga sp. BPS33]
MLAAHDHLSVRDYGASHGSHDHDHFQVLVGLHGVLELEVAGHGQRIAVGDGCVVPPGERHDFEGRGETRCLVLDSRDPHWAHAVATPPPGLLPLAHYLATAISVGLPRARQLGAGLLLEAWLQGNPMPIRQEERNGRPIDWAALCQWLPAHWHTRLSVADLAARANLSPSQFTARCQAEQGDSPMQWLRRQRLAQARIWRAGGLSVADTARRTGYRSPSALTAALRREPAR